jgi:predicted ATPase
VAADGLPADFHQYARSWQITARPAHSFIGREKALSMLRFPAGRRLATLTGAGGGGGKTRLAPGSGDLLTEFADGARLVELA